MKRISKYQLQGITGEKVFEDWAARNDLLATKLSPDQGMDYVCQVIDDVSDKTNKLSYMTPGKILAFAVRSSDKAESKAKINRDDAELLLRMNIPTVLAIIDLRATGDLPRVYIRFLDKRFTEELLTFLKGSKRSRTIKTTSVVRLTLLYIWRFWIIFYRPVRSR